MSDSVPVTKSSWTLVLPNSPFTSANDRHHWSKRAANSRTWRDTTCWLARAEQIGPQSAITVELHYWPKDRRRRDPDNLVSGVLKPCVDGLVDAGIVPDDAPPYVLIRMPRIMPPRPDRQIRWELIITTR